MRNTGFLILLLIFGAVFIAAIYEALLRFKTNGNTTPDLLPLEPNGLATTYGSSTSDYSSSVTRPNSTTADAPAESTFTNQLHKQRNLNVGSVTSSRVWATTGWREKQIPMLKTNTEIHPTTTEYKFSYKETTFTLTDQCNETRTQVSEGIIMSPETYPQEESCFTWFIDVGVGYSIDIVISSMHLDGTTGDYLIISPSQEELAEPSNPVFTWYLKSAKYFRILDRGTAFILFKAFFKNDTSDYQGFEIHYNRYGNSTSAPDTSTQPALPTPPADVDQSVVVYISMATKTLVIEEFFNRSIEFRSAVSNMATTYCNETGIDLSVEPSYENVILNSVNPCQLTWPDSSTCLRIRMTVPVNNTNASIYELSSQHLQEMWDRYAKDYVPKYIEEMQVYHAPDSLNFVLWIVVSVCVILTFSALLGLIWKIDIFQKKESEGEMILEEDTRRTSMDNILISVPPSFKAEIFDPEKDRLEGYKRMSYGDINRNSTISVDTTDTISRYAPPGGFGAAPRFPRMPIDEEEEVHYERIGGSKKISYDNMYDEPKINLTDEPKLSTVL